MEHLSIYHEVHFSVPILPLQIPPFIMLSLLLSILTPLFRILTLVFWEPTTPRRATMLMEALFILKTPRFLLTYVILKITQLKQEVPFIYSQAMTCILKL